MKKDQLIASIAEKHKITKVVAAEIVETIIDSLIDSIVNAGVAHFRPFGTFKRVIRKARIGRNPKTGEHVNIPAKHSVKFQASKELKTRLVNLFD